jgi:uncharacterized protein YydD (DUF2326 family)
MGDEAQVTLTEVSKMTGLHKNTIRNYVKKGLLKAEKVELEGVMTWVIKREDLYNSGIPRLNSRLGPQEVDITMSRAETERHAVPEKYLEEMSRLTRELLATTEEIAALRARVPALQAAQEERDKLREDLEVARLNNAVLKEKLTEAQANAKWSWRRRQKKESGNA